MLPAELNQLEARIQRLITAYHQMQLERTRAVQECARLQNVNSELRQHITGIVERLRALEDATP